MTLAELRRQRGVAFDAFKALAEKPSLSEDETKDYQARERAVVDFDDQITRFERAQALAAATAQPVAGQEQWTVPAAPETDPYLSEAAAEARGIKTRKGLVIGGMMRMVGRAQQLFTNPREVAVQQYG